MQVGEEKVRPEAGREGLLLVRRQEEEEREARVQTQARPLPLEEEVQTLRKSLAHVGWHVVVEDEGSCGWGRVRPPRVVGGKEPTVPMMPRLP